jgi:hypothetical protein
MGRRIEMNFDGFFLLESKNEELVITYYMFAYIGIVVLLILKLLKGKFVVIARNINARYSENIKKCLTTNIQ